MTGFVWTASQSKCNFDSFNGIISAALINFHLRQRRTQSPIKRASLHRLRTLDKCSFLLMSHHSGTPGARRRLQESLPCPSCSTTSFAPEPNGRPSTAHTVGLAATTASTARCTEKCTGSSSLPGKVPPHTHTHTHTHTHEPRHPCSQTLLMK